MHGLKYLVELNTVNNAKSRHRNIDVKQSMWHPFLRMQYNMNEPAIGLCACNSAGHFNLIYSLFE